MMPSFFFFSPVVSASTSLASLNGVVTPMKASTTSTRSIPRVHKRIQVHRCRGGGGLLGCRLHVHGPVVNPHARSLHAGQGTFPSKYFSIMFPTRLAKLPMPLARSAL